MPNKLDGHDIKDLRKRLKLTQRQMADKLGVAEFTVLRWEKQKARPSQLAMRQLHRMNKKANNA